MVFHTMFRQVHQICRAVVLPIWSPCGLWCLHVPDGFFACIRCHVSLSHFGYQSRACCSSPSGVGAFSDNALAVLAVSLRHQAHRLKCRMGTVGCSPQAHTSSSLTGLGVYNPESCQEFGSSSSSPLARLLVPAA